MQTLVRTAANGAITLVGRIRSRRHTAATRRHDSHSAVAASPPEVLPSGYDLAVEERFKVAGAWVTQTIALCRTREAAWAAIDSTGRPWGHYYAIRETARRATPVWSEPASGYPDGYPESAALGFAADAARTRAAEREEG